LLAEVVKVTNHTRGFPGGVRPTVGVAGFILGGGFGGFTRYAGLGADNLIAIKGVDANGNVINADKDNNPELLWASRGAGGGKFVIVTDFNVRLMDVTPGTQPAYSSGCDWQSTVLLF
jgi:FAD/FMN-containing dehydrogenase